MHAVAPMTEEDWYVPALHPIHEVAMVCGWYVPTPHEIHEVAMVDHAKDPDAQESQAVAPVRG